MPFHSEKIHIPKSGHPITFEKGLINCPDRPIIGFIEGDGIGPDIWKASKRVLDAAVEKSYSGKKKIEWTEIFAGEKSQKAFGEWLPADTLDFLRTFHVGIKGPLATPVGTGIRSLNVALRHELDLYACVRPVKWYKGTPSPVKEPQNCDIVIFRENTEDVYCGIEFEAGKPETEEIRAAIMKKSGKKIRENSGIGIKPISKFGSQRLIAKAIQYAIDNNRKSVTLVHKGNIMKYTEGAFAQWGYECARSQFGDLTIPESELAPGETPPPSKIVIRDRIADAMFQFILLRPTDFDVIACPNLNGDYLSDASAAQVGGLGIAPGGNIGEETALFEATHGTAPKYAGKNLVNPGSMILSGVMMLEYLGWTEAAESIKKGLQSTIQAKHVTYDLARQLEGSTSIGTNEFATAIIKHMAP